MRSFIPAYEMQTPRSLGAALDVLAHDPGVWRPFAGGTDLMVLLEAGKLAHRRYLNIWNLAELRGVQSSSWHISLGEMCIRDRFRKSAA